MRLSERTFGTASLGLGLLLITIMSTALAAFNDVGVWLVVLLGATVLGLIFVLAGVGIVGISKGVAAFEQQSQIDPLTGLPNADRLALDLADVLAEGTDAVFSLHLMDGFKSYNEAYGRACGDTMLLWLADKATARCARTGGFYRMRGGEFALLARGSDEHTLDVRAAVADALLETGEGFVIRSRSGEVVLPGHTHDGQRDAQGGRPSGAESTHRGTSRRGGGAAAGRDRDHADRGIAVRCRRSSRPTSDAAWACPPTGSTTSPPPHTCATSATWRSRVRSSVRSTS